MFKGMMKSLFAILLSVVLLAGQMSLTIGTHICQGEAIETRIIYGGTHLGCGMEDMSEPCDINDQQDVSFSKEQCCENQYQTLQTTEDFVNDASQLNLSLDFAVAFVSSLLNIDLSPRATHQFNTAYLPPPLDKDIQVLFQTFLI